MSVVVSTYMFIYISIHVCIHIYYRYQSETAWLSKQVKDDADRHGEVLQRLGDRPLSYDEMYQGPSEDDIEQSSFLCRHFFLFLTPVHNESQIRNVHGKLAWIFLFLFDQILR